MWAAMSISDLQGREGEGRGEEWSGGVRRGEEREEGKRGRGGEEKVIGRWKEDGLVGWTDVGCKDH